MTTRRMALPPYPAFRLLALGVVVLVVLIAVAWLTGQRWQAPDPLLPEVSALAAERLVLPAAQPDAVDIVAARPLFAPDRRPPQPGADPAADAKPAPDLLSQARLVGVLGSGKDSVALLQTTEGGKRLRVGQALHGWRLAGIDPRGATFEREAGDRENPKIEQRQLPFARVAQARVGQPPRPRR